MVYASLYQNDGSGRDTFINGAGAFWLNPVPHGSFKTSTRGNGGDGGAGACLGGTLGDGLAASSANLGGSRYGSGEPGATAFDADQLINDRLVPLDRTSPSLLLQSAMRNNAPPASSLVRGEDPDKLMSGTLQLDKKTLESTTHFSLRTGLYPVPDNAPPPAQTFAPKGSLTQVVW